MYNESKLSDDFQIAMSRARELVNGVGLVGFGVIELRDGAGRLKLSQPFANLITTAGDQYYAQKGIVGISPANPSAPTAVNGMKLGTATTAVHKSTAGGANIATGGYISGSNVAFDATFPTATAVGGDAGWNATYKTTWGAGVATNAAITEAAIVNDQATNAFSTAANTISRVVFTAVNKGASDTLAITWTHKFLGA